MGVTLKGLAQQLSVQVPSGVDGTKPGYALFTWNSIGIIDEPSMRAITHEAWLRQPTTVTKSAGISGNWVLHYSWGSTGNYGQANITFNNNGTFAGASGGKWIQQDGTLLWSYDSGPAKYSGNINSNVGSGAMSTFTGSNGSWYLVKQGTVGISSASAATGSSQPRDAAGNRL